MEEYNNSEDDLLKLLKKYMDNTCTREELRELLSRIESEPDKEALSESLKTYWEQSKNTTQNFQINWDDKFSLMMKRAGSRQNELRVANAGTKYCFINWVTAAIIILMISAGAYWLNARKSPSESS